MKLGQILAFYNLGVNSFLAYLVIAWKMVRKPPVRHTASGPLNFHDGLVFYRLGLWAARFRVFVAVAGALGLDGGGKPKWTKLGDAAALRLQPPGVGQSLAGGSTGQSQTLVLSARARM